MPQIVITIDEHAEAKILDCIQKRRDFVIDGGRVWDGEKQVFLRGIRFSFHESESSLETEKKLIPR